MVDAEDLSLQGSLDAANHSVLSENVHKVHQQIITQAEHKIRFTVSVLKFQLKVKYNFSKKFPYIS